MLLKRWEAAGQHVLSEGGQDTIDELHCSDIGIEFVQRTEGEHCRLADGRGGCETMLSTSANARKFSLPAYLIIIKVG